MSIRSRGGAFAAIAALWPLAACSSLTLVPPNGAPAVDAYIGMRCSGKYYAEWGVRPTTYPYVFEIIKFRQGPPGLSAMYADGITLRGAYVHSVTLRGGDFIIRTSNRVYFRGVPIDAQHIHMFRFVKQPRRFVSDSMATCKTGTPN